MEYDSLEFSQYTHEPLGKCVFQESLKLLETQPHNIYVILVKLVCNVFIYVHRSVSAMMTCH